MPTNIPELKLSCKEEWDKLPPSQCAYSCCWCCCKSGVTLVAESMGLHTSVPHKDFRLDLFFCFISLYPSGALNVGLYLCRVPGVW